MENNKKYGAMLLAIYAFLAIYLVPIFPHGGSANELTRWASTVSLIEKGSFEYSWSEPLVGPIVDSAKAGDKTYSNKAPAPALLSAPFYAIIKLFTGPANESNIRISWDILRIIISSLPLFLLGLWLWKKEIDSFALAILLFATPLFSYSLLYFSHVLTAVLLYAAFRLLFDKKEEAAEKAAAENAPANFFAKYPLLRYLLAGLACGAAVLSEFPAAIAVVVFAVFLIIDKSAAKQKNIGLFILGGVPSLIFLFAYNNALFGSPFSFSYGNEAFGEWAAVANQGFLGISFPTPEKIWISFLSPARGLFFYAPILILALILLFRAKGKGETRHKVALWASLIVLIVMAGHGAPHGGWGMSARYAILILPLLLDSFIRGESVIFGDFWKGLLFCASFLLCALPLLSFPFAPPEFAFPHNDFWRVFWIGEGWFTPTLFGAGIAAISPVILAFGAVIAITALNAKDKKNFAIGSLAAILLIAAYVFMPNLDNSEATRLRRASIAERYFKPAKRIEAFQQDAMVKKDWQSLFRINAAYWNIADARAYAPGDWPYLEAGKPASSPSALMKNVLALQKQGKMVEAGAVLQRGKEEHPFAKCEFATNLAVVFYSTNQKDKALAELEAIKDLPNKASRPECQRSQFLLGSLYKELGRMDEAKAILANYLSISEGASDKQAMAERQQAKAMMGQ